MTVERRLGALALLIASGAGMGCDSMKNADDAPPVDATPTVLFERFSSTTWSLASANGGVQLSISDVPGAAACALAADQHNKLTAAGVQIILQLPDMPSGTCPVGNYVINGCTNTLGSAAFVPKGCAYYRKFDASGNVLGSAAALNGTVKLGGTATECAMQVTIGFYGASFTEQFSLMNGDAQQPWCRDT